MAREDSALSQLREWLESQSLVESVGAGVEPSELDTREREARLTSWAQEEEFKRGLRKWFGPSLLVVLVAQIALINTFVFLLGWGKINVPGSVATAFIGATIAELAGMVILILRYLFPAVRS